MSYQVLARKWRPQNFHQLVGQEHVKQALVNALSQQRLHHAYLFTGTRGVGKTTIARIFAKSLNCDLGITSEPCGQCSSCLDIEAGKFIDLIEVDAASRTKVEDTREILDNVQYAPTRGRYKVYLIDEVHMLSKHSFNALLKTLEEPPLHVKFLLATTDPQKLPVTILSRCLQFNLSALTQNAIEDQLANILQQEQIQFEQEALQCLAVAAKGSMRDALSLTDQAIAQTNHKVELAPVKSMLGLMDVSWSKRLFSAVLVGDGSELMNTSAQLALQNGNFSAVLDDLISLTHLILMAQLVPQAARLSEFDSEFIAQIAKQTSPSEIQVYYQLLLNGKKDLALAPAKQLGFEMVMLKLLAFDPAEQQQAVTAKPQQQGATQPERSSLKALLKQQIAATKEIPTPVTSNEVAPNDAMPSVAPQTHAQDDDLEQQMADEFNQVMQAASELQAVEQHYELAEVADNAAYQPVERPGVAQSSNTQSASQSPSVNASNEPPEVQFDTSHLQQIEHQESAAIHSILQRRNVTGSSTLLPADGSPAKKSEPQQGAEFSPAPPSFPEAGQHNTFVTEHSPSENVAERIHNEQGFENTVYADKAHVAPSQNTQSTKPVQQKVSPLERFKPDPANVAPELIAQLSPEPEKPVVDKKPVIAIPEGFESPISAIRFAHQQDDWASIIEAMGLGGRVRQFALHSVMDKQAHNVLLTTDASQQHLDSQGLRESLQVSLAGHFNQAITLNVNYQENVANTPFLIQQAIDAHRHQQAIQTIISDANVQTFTQHFDAEVDESTIRAL